MSKFKVGDKVVCVTHWEGREVPKSRHRIFGKEYSVADVRIGWGGAEQINCVGSPSDCWHESAHYELVKQATYHKHHDLIIAWAKGAKIEVSPIGSNFWRDCPIPTWDCDYVQFRIKPQPKPDVVEIRVVATPDLVYIKRNEPNDKVRCTYDGETGKLKAVELIGDSDNV